MSRQLQKFSQDTEETMIAEIIDRLAAVEKLL